MTTSATAPTSDGVDLRDLNAHISRVPYLPGLDGMRALAVIAVMIYHANSDWLPGGFLGVEMFFVISGYLITLLIIAERERTYRVSLVDFWKRRARRLLPALYVLLIGVTVYTALFEPEAVGQLRGDVVAGLFYVSNWYQLWVGLGYTAAFDFAPLRHLWSLAVEEQFYLIWPLAMVALLGRRSTRKIANASRWLFFGAVFIAVVTALLYHPGVIGEPEQTPEAYWWIGDRPISKLDFLYIGSFSRLGGIMLGAAFAMVWRPIAVGRGPLRTKGSLFDVVGLLALVGFAWMCLNIYLVTPEGTADSRLFQGGLFLSSVLTVLVIAAVAHPHARANRLLGNRLLVWIGVRSYGLYLFHWPVYQAIRKLAGNKLTVSEFVVAMVITVIITELSFRLIETPIRRGTFRTSVREARRSPHAGRRRGVVVAALVAVSATLFAAGSLVVADVNQSEIAADLDDAQDATVSLAAADPADLVDEGDAAAGGDEPRVADGGGDDVPLAVDTDDDEGDDPGDGVDAVDGGTGGVGDDADGAAGEPGDASDDLVPVESVPSVTTVPAPGDAPVVPVTTGAPALEAPVVPASTVPPPEASGPVQLGVVADLAGITPLGVPPPSNSAPQAIPIIALGDSVMLGAAEELKARGVNEVDAQVSRQFSAFVPELETIRANGLLGSVVIVHLGTNGSFPQSSLDRMMELLWDVPVVVFVTGKADRPWVAGNNEKIRALPATWENTTVVDWEMLGPQCPDDCFYDDNIHLNQAGQNYYADIMATLLGL